MPMPTTSSTPARTVEYLSGPDLGSLSPWPGNSVKALTAVKEKVKSFVEAGAATPEQLEAAQAAYLEARAGVAGAQATVTPGARGIECAWLTESRTGCRRKPWKTAPANSSSRSPITSIP